jgi:hypothetical protein
MIQITSVVAVAGLINILMNGIVHAVRMIILLIKYIAYRWSNAELTIEIIVWTKTT